MIRLGVVAAGAVAVIGAAWVTGASIPESTDKSRTGPPKPEEKVVAIVGQKIGFFNMAKVMREYKRAKTAVERLNEKRVRMSANLMGMRAMYIEIQKAAQASPPGPLGPDLRQEERGAELLLLARRIEDTDREIQKLLNNQASVIIGELHDEIRAMTADLARERGLSAVLTYPDAVTPQEAESPQIKELRLKPPAAHPFYLDPSVDYTDELLQRLNAKFAAENGE